MSRIIENAREVREKILAYIQKYPGLLAEDIWYNNARFNREMVTRTLRYLHEAGLVRRDGNRQAAKWYAL